MNLKVYGEISAYYVQTLCLITRTRSPLPCSNTVLPSTVIEHEITL